MLNPNSAVSLTGQSTTVKLIRAVDTLIHNENVDLPKSRVSNQQVVINYPTECTQIVLQKFVVQWNISFH